MLSLYAFMFRIRAACGPYQAATASLFIPSIWSVDNATVDSCAWEIAIEGGLQLSRFLGLGVDKWGRVIVTLSWSAGRAGDMDKGGGMLCVCMCVRV
jgi:hypothetical protein